MDNPNARIKSKVAATISEIFLQSNESRVTIPRFSRPNILQKACHIHKSQLTSAQRLQPPKEISSVETISIQNLQDGRKKFKRPIVGVPFRTKELRKTESSSERGVFVTKKQQRAPDLSSVNSHFENMVFNVPLRHNRKCVTSSSHGSIFEIPKKKPKKKNEVGSSQEMIDSKHAPSPPHQKFKGPEWDEPCKESFIAGAPRPYIGKCPPNVEKIENFSKGRQKFFLTQDPRKKYCLTNPQVLRSKEYSEKKQFGVLTNMVKHAKNLCAGDESQSSESFICEVVDLENPLKLDFQGMDYQKTYQIDEFDQLKRRAYLRVGRYVERRKIKQSMRQNVKEEMQQARLAIPECFQIYDRKEVLRTPTPEPSIKYGRLFRSVDKPRNKEVIAAEHNRRKGRYKDLLLNKMKREEKEEKERQEAEAKAQEDLAFNLAKASFNNALNDVETAIQQSFKTERLLRKVEVKTRIFPHTLRETQLFKNKIKQENRVRRDTALVKKNFYLDHLNIKKSFPDAQADIDSINISHDSPISEQSTDDEDNLQVGKEADIFKLRGFHFKLNDKLRGKLHQRQIVANIHKKRKCKTREEWLSEIFPKKEQIRLDVEQGIEKIKNPDDPQLELFRPKFGFKPPKKNNSAIREYIQRRLGRHYERVLRRNLRILKPRLQYKVQKFNLIGYLYGNLEDNIKNVDPDNVLLSTQQYIVAKEQLKKKKADVLKYKRLKLLGIPCKKIEKTPLELCVRSESSEGEDWVPKPEWVLEEEMAAEAAAEAAAAAAAIEKQKHGGEETKSNVERDTITYLSELSDISRATAQRLTAGETKPLPSRIPVPFHLRGNMPAPKFRETTLRIHPRRPRDFENERVDSEDFEEAVETTGLAFLKNLAPDMLHYENVRTKKRPYIGMFEGRHHHDHWKPTQLKAVNVHYKPKIVEPKPEKIKPIKADRKLMEHFRMANPPCNAFIDMDLTMRRADTNALINEQLTKKGPTRTDKKAKGPEDKCEVRDFVFHSRPPKDFEDLDYPGRQEFLQFLEEIKSAVSDMRVKDDGEEELCINKDDLIKELEEDLKSIESCLTSLDSSQCTNLSNDSGSFLLMENQWKVPLDYVRKALVPFEELQRARFEARIIDVNAEDADPFKVFPFSGQRKQQLASAGAKDSFFTFNTRLKNGLRLRLEVPVEDIRKKLIGRGRQKHPGIVITDLDENYVTDLKDRPPVKMFNFKTATTFIKKSLRLKFETLMIQGQMVRKIIYDRLNEQNWENMLKMKDLYEKLFAKWEKREYDDSMSVVYQVEKFYEKTDRLKVLYRALERELVILNMDIVFLEGHWIRRIMLQNFHYLLGDQEWRYVNDWIHRKVTAPPERVSVGSVEESEMGSEEDNEESEAEEGNEKGHGQVEEEIELESFEESIAKRTTANIRKRDKDDAWAIKAFYEDVYKKNEHPILVVFPDADSFLKGIENLKAKTFVLLMEMHFVLAIHTELQAKLETFEEWCIRDLREKTNYVERKCSKKYFMEDRANDLQFRVRNFLDKPFETSFADERHTRDRGVIYEVWKEVVPATTRGSSDQMPDPTDMTAMISDVVIDVIGKFETIPLEKRRPIEQKLRRRLAYDQKMSAQAYQIERRIESEMKKVRKNLEPPYKKPRRIGKLPRLFIVKKEHKVVIEEKPMSEHAKFFYKAFHAEEDELGATDARESIAAIDNIQEQIVPFYFDHFLKTHGYIPNYSFKTQTDLRDGPEVGLFRLHKLVPEILDRLEEWEKMQLRVMEDNIQRNPRMYENIE